MDEEQINEQAELDQIAVRQEKFEQLKSTINAKNFVQSLAERVAQKLLLEIDRGNAYGAFTIILFIAVFKDYLDFLYSLAEEGITLTGIGAVVMLIIKPIEILVMGFLAITLYILMRNMGFFLKFQVKIIFWCLAALSIIPVLSFFPFETATVLYAWKKVQQRKQKAMEKKEKLNKMTSKQLQELDNNISILDNEELPRDFRGAKHKEQLEEQVHKKIARNEKLENFQKKYNYNNDII